MKNSATPKVNSTTHKQNSTSNKQKKNKKNSKEKGKLQNSTSEPSTSSTHYEKSSSKESRTYVGLATEQLAAIIEHTGEQLTEEVAAAFVEDINYKLRFVIHDALTRARLSGRRGITYNDINDTFECLGIEKVYGSPNKPNWNVVSEPTGRNIHYLEDPVVNLFDLAELSEAYIEPKDTLVTQKYLPEVEDTHLQKYFNEICKAAVNENRKICYTALYDVRCNTSIGPIIDWFYSFCYTLLSKDVTYDGITIPAVEFLENLEYNPLSRLTVSENQIIQLSDLLFQRLLKSGGTRLLIKPICRTLSVMCRRNALRKVILKKMVTKYNHIKRFFVYPIMCLANDLGIDGVSVIIATNVSQILQVMQLNRDPNFVLEALRSYFIICNAETEVGDISLQFQDVFGDGIIPFWKNVSDVPEEKLEQYDWFNVKKKLFQSRKKVLLSSNSSQRKISIDEAFPIENEDPAEGVNSKVLVKPKISQRTKMRLIHPTSFELTKSETFLIIGKRTLLANTLSKKHVQLNCSCHNLMYHNF